jgi:Uncharacterized protein conserved in bacteria
VAQQLLLSLIVLSTLAAAPLFGTHPSPVQSRTIQAIQGHFTSTVTLGTLDKVTARTSQITVQVGETVTLGTLQIKVLRAWSADAEEMPEAKVFLEINEYKSGQGLRQIFRGWMFASTPSVSALEHPVYDLWVIEAHGIPAPPPAAPEAPAEQQHLAPEADQKIDKLIRDMIKTEPASP